MHDNFARRSAGGCSSCSNETAEGVTKLGLSENDPQRITHDNELRLMPRLNRAWGAWTLRVSLQNNHPTTCPRHALAWCDATSGESVGRLVVARNASKQAGPKHLAGLRRWPKSQSDFTFLGGRVAGTARNARGGR